MTTSHESRFAAWVSPALAVVLLLASSAQLFAFAGYVGLWENLYPASSSSRASCALCHNGFRLNEYNAYGWDIRLGLDARLSNLQAILAAETLDSDGEGSTNLEEIDADTQPGWTVGPNNTTYDSRGNSQSNQTAPASIPGELDPANSNAPPVADPGGPYEGAVGQPLLFDGSGSSDVDGTIVAYDWDFGDGDTGTGQFPTHSYDDEGIHNVTLTVTDDGGLTDTTTTTAIIEAATNQPPVADAGGPYTGAPGQAVQFDGSGSSDMDGTIVEYSWDFGDGGVAEGECPTHTYAAEGFYDVTLTVTDDGGLTDTATTFAFIQPATNQPPVADAGGPYTGAPGQAVQFDGSGSYDPDGSISIYFWDFGDGELVPEFQGPTPTHTYDNAGDYSVSLTVVDNKGEMDTVVTSAKITKSDPPPTGNVWTVRVGVPGEEFELQIEDVDGLLMIEESFPDGRVIPAIGLENAGYIIWFDVIGSLFYGTVDRDAGTMMGIVFDFMGIIENDSIWFAEQP